MSVVSVKELFRKSVFAIGTTRQLSREFVCVLSDAVLSAPIDGPQIGAAIGIDLGSVHPTYGNNKCSKITITEGHEGSPYHVHVLAEYRFISDRELASPTSRASLWEFDTAPGEVPAFFYYDGAGNGTMRPLTNSAYDYFPGLVTQESLVAAKVTKNFASLPTSWIAAQNFTNDAAYLGGPMHTWKVAAVRVAQTEEEFGGSVVQYWQATAELHYRQSSHNLQLPDIGFNFIGGGQKRRAMVFDFQNTEWVPSPNAVGLDGGGGLSNGFPAILNRRVLPVADFTVLFGTPPTTPIN